MQSPLNKVLGSLESAGLIRPAGQADQGGYVIRHALVQDTAYQSILRSDRREIHRAVGETLRDLFPEPEVAAVLAHHFERAQLEALAYKYHLMAADAAYEQYANFEAVDHYERAIAFLELDELERDELIRVHRYYERALELIGEFEPTLNVLDKLIEHAENRADPGMKLIALIGKARLQATLTPVHDHQAAKELANQALEMARQIGDREREVRALWVLMLADLYREKDLEAAERYGLEALEKARALDEVRPLALVLTDLARTYMTMGRADRSLPLAEEGYELWKEDGNLVMQVDVCSLIGSVSLINGDIERSRSAFEEALRVSEEIENPWGKAVTQSNAALADHMRGRTEEALDRLESAKRISREGSIPAAEMISGFFNAWIYSDLGATDAGVELCRTILQKEEQKMMWHRALILATWSRLVLVRGQAEEARELLEEAREVQERTDSTGWMWNPVPLARVELLAAEGDYGESAGLASELVKDFEARGARLFIPELLCHRASALIELGRHDEAAEALDQAKTRAQEMGLQRDLWRIDAEAARLHAQAGREEQAQQASLRAGEALQSLLEHINDPELVESFRSRPLVAKLLEADGDSGT